MSNYSYWFFPRFCFWSHNMFRKIAQYLFAVVSFVVICLAYYFSIDFIANYFAGFDTLVSEKVIVVLSIASVIIFILLLFKYGVRELCQQYRQSPIVVAFLLIPMFFGFIITLTALCLVVLGPAAFFMQVSLDESIMFLIPCIIVCFFFFLFCIFISSLST